MPLSRPTVWAQRVSLLSATLVASLPAPVHACDGACCDFPTPQFEVLGHIDTGVFIRAIGYHCDDSAADDSFDRGWGMVRRLEEHQYTGVLSSIQHRPRFLSVQLDAVEAYRPEELLFWWTKLTEAADSTASLARSVRPFSSQSPAVTSRTRGGRRQLLDTNGNLLVSYGDELNFVARAGTVYSDTTVPFVVVEVEQKSSLGNYPEHFRTLDFFALPGALDIVVFDGTGQKPSDVIQQDVRAAVKRVQSVGFRRVAFRAAANVHEKSKIFHRKPLDEETAPFRALGGPVLLRDHFGPGVRTLLRAAADVPRDAECGADCLGVMPRNDLSWDENADIVLIVGKDWPHVVKQLASTMGRVATPMLPEAR